MKRTSLLTRAILRALPLFLILLTVHPASAQLLRANVKVNLQKLPQENQNKLRGIDHVVESYINEREWASNDYQYEFNLDIEIYFDEAVAVSFEDRYKAQIAVSNRGNMVYNDKRWELVLEPGVRLQYVDDFDSFRSMFDYYVFMALGYEFDKVRKFGGTPYFETARRICQQARFSSRYFLGWDKREEWVTDVLAPDNETSRYLDYLFYTGEWLFYTEHDRKEARQYFLYATRLFDRINEEKLQRFFDLNYYNYASALAEYGEFNAVTKLASTDPNPEHASFYQRLLEKR
ncbi:MAG: DUF4835 family protein [bacterium]